MKQTHTQKVKEFFTERFLDLSSRNNYQIDGLNRTEIADDFQKCFFESVKELRNPISKTEVQTLIKHKALDQIMPYLGLVANIQLAWIYAHELKEEFSQEAPYYGIQELKKGVVEADNYHRVACSLIDHIGSDVVALLLENMYLDLSDDGLDVIYGIEYDKG